MTYNSGTATDYIDLLDQLVEVVTSRHLDEIAINAAGTGYVVGDVLGIDGTGATATHVAQIEVRAVGGSGEITTARIYRGGAYTVDPTTTTGNSASGGSGASATFDLTFAATGWTQLARESEAVSATVDTAGNGYNVNDTLTLVGGVLAPGGSAATFNVDTLTGGAGTGVATVSLVSAGDYEVFPADPVLTTNDGTGDNACTLDVTWQDVAGDTIVVLQGDAGSATDPLVGIKTYSSETDETGLNAVANWALFGMTSWSGTQALHQQSNVSPGFSTAADGAITTSVTGDGAFVPLKGADAFNIEWRIAATGRRVVLMAKIESATTTYYAHASFGLLNQFGTSTEYAFPAYVAGTSDRKRVWYRDTSSIFGGLSEVIMRANGPFFVWAPEGQWIRCWNATISSNQLTTPAYDVISTAPRAMIWPLGVAQTHETIDDRLWDDPGAAGFDNDDLTLIANAVAIHRTPDSGGDAFPLLPVTAMQHDSASDAYRIFGAIEGVWWIHDGGEGISSEDREFQGALAFELFQNGTRVEPFSFLALQED